VKTTKPKAAADARIGVALARRERAELLDLLRPCFARTEPWLQARKYAAAVMSQVPKRNGWTIAAHAGDRTLDKTQRLLSRAVWDAFATMGVVRRFAVAGLDEAARKTGRRRGLAVGAIDETGQVKAGELTAGVKRQYLGCVGKVANGINTVHLDFVCGDEVYGACTELREFCQDHGQAYALRVPSSFRLMLPGGITLTCCTAAPGPPHPPRPCQTSPRPPSSG
jgi:hypothetical protein